MLAGKAKIRRECVHTIRSEAVDLVPWKLPATSGKYVLKFVPFRQCRWFSYSLGALCRNEICLAQDTQAKQRDVITSHVNLHFNYISPLLLLPSPPFRLDEARLSTFDTRSALVTWNFLFHYSRLRGGLKDVCGILWIWNFHDIFHRCLCMHQRGIRQTLISLGTLAWTAWSFLEELKSWIPSASIALSVGVFIFEQFFVSSFQARQQRQECDLFFHIFFCWDCGKSEVNM